MMIRLRFTTIIRTKLVPTAMVGTIFYTTVQLVSHSCRQEEPRLNTYNAKYIFVNGVSGVVFYVKPKQRIQQKKNGLFASDYTAIAICECGEYGIKRQCMSINMSINLTVIIYYIYI